MLADRVQVPVPDQRRVRLQHAPGLPHKAGQGLAALADGEEVALDPAALRLSALLRFPLSDQLRLPLQESEGLSLLL